MKQLPMILALTFVFFPLMALAQNAEDSGNDTDENNISIKKLRTIVCKGDQTCPGQCISNTYHLNTWNDVQSVTFNYTEKSGRISYVEIQTGSDEDPYKDIILLGDNASCHFGGRFEGPSQEILE